MYTPYLHFVDFSVTHAAVLVYQRNKDAEPAPKAKEAKPLKLAEPMEHAEPAKNAGAPLAIHTAPNPPSVVDEGVKAKEILAKAGISGRDMLAAIVAVRRGELTVEDVADAHKDKLEVKRRLDEVKPTEEAKKE